MSRELHVSIGRKVITLLDVHDNIVKRNYKLAGIIKIVLSLDELYNTNKLENRRPNNILLRYHVTGS